MTHRMVRVLCSTIVLAIVLASLAVPLLYQTAVLADGVDGGVCRTGHVDWYYHCEPDPALVASGTNGWNYDGDGGPVADGIDVGTCYSGYGSWYRGCVPAAVASGTNLWIRDGEGAPVAEAIDGGECRSGYIVTCGRCEPAAVADSGTIYWGRQPA